jgi:hypothetical protein
MSTDTIPITLTLAERHTLHDLLDSFMQDLAGEDVRTAHYSLDLEAASARLRRLAAIRSLAEGAGELPVADLELLHNELATRGAETESTVEEHDATVADANPGAWKMIAEERQLSAIDYAHQCVCERIVVQINAAREGVPA